MSGSQLVQRFPMLCVAVASAVLPVACNGSDLTRVGLYNATHLTQLAGLVTTAAGQPLDSVRVRITIPSPAPYSYADTVVQSGADGRYLLTIRRTNGPATVGLPDTVRAIVNVETQRVSDRGADGLPIRATSSIVLEFTPHYVEPRRAQLNLSIGGPD